MNLLMRLLAKWQKRNMCRCVSPSFIVKRGIVCCAGCDKPVHKADMEIV